MIVRKSVGKRFAIKFFLLTPFCGNAVGFAHTVLNQSMKAKKALFLVQYRFNCVSLAHIPKSTGFAENVKANTNIYE